MVQTMRLCAALSGAGWTVINTMRELLAGRRRAVEPMTTQLCKARVGRPGARTGKRGSPQERPRTRPFSAEPGGRAVSVTKTYCRYHPGKKKYMSSHHRHATLQSTHFHPATAPNVTH